MWQGLLASRVVWTSQSLASTCANFWAISARSLSRDRCASRVDASSSLRTTFSPFSLPNLSSSTASRATPTVKQRKKCFNKSQMSDMCMKLWTLCCKTALLVCSSSPTWCSKLDVTSSSCLARRSRSLVRMATSSTSWSLDKLHDDQKGVDQDNT